MIKVKDNNIIAYNASESLIESIIKDVFLRSNAWILLIY